MRGLLILGGLVILSAAAWTGTADAGGGGHGSGHGGHGHGGLEGRMTRGAGHVDLVGILLSTEFWHEEAGPGPVAPEMFSGGVMVDGSEHVVADHLEGPAIHPIAPYPATARGGSGLDPAADRTRRRRIGPRRRGDGAALSRGQPLVAASPGRRRPRSAGIRVVRPGATRTGTTREPSMMRRECPERPSGDQFR